jgi:hypothetical protein
MPHPVHFPDPTVIDPALATEFMRMMFAHTALERQVFALQAAVRGDQNFPGSRWRVNEWPENMVNLIEKKKSIENGLVTVAEVEEIARWLTNAKPYCDRRNHLAHGAWWLYHVETAAIKIRRWEGKQPVFECFMLDDICEITGNFKAIAYEIYRLQCAIEDRRGWHDFAGPNDEP